ncbi:hypothetical protein AAZX31_10G261200 [Glycine max]|uniref:Uncharacterized protein n=2 Tax=Glycine subgen. Soja TaxID=1462606 RepID=I1LEX3_SOYBN|nr:hypothetical protein JHK87_029318 [Glycine soja]KAG4998606.1 hypothetical protein JHK85_030045 [Glycine max]KAG5005375.1 hypothetical protein JHK86_029514 [Glycine max]KAG5128564.1 hypothetical protein JHK82_029399 [Glycine max]KAG5153170.1 hypothetical protein JHK84_029642 [Glycine max]
MSDAKEKRKQSVDDDAVPESQQQKKAREEEVVTDEEVEEFYAILRRINTAVKYFKSYGDDVAALEKDIMQDVKEGMKNEKEGHVQGNLSLDLNATPQNPT